MDKKGCGSRTTMGHGDVAVCGQVWWDKVYECQSCQIKRLTAATTWQPIEIAPKDGTLVLVYEPLNGVMIGYYRGQWAEATEAVPIEPTHWMPLPEPPK